MLVRDPSRLPSEGPQPAHVVVGDVRQPADVDKTVAGQDAVVVLLGTRNDLSTEPPLCPRPTLPQPWKAQELVCQRLSQEPRQVFPP